MDKKQVIKHLHEMRTYVQIADITCDIYDTKGKLCYSEKHILVPLRDEEKVTAKDIVISNAYTFFDSIEDFENNAVCTPEEVIKFGAEYYFGNFIYIDRYDKFVSAKKKPFFDKCKEIYASIELVLHRLLPFGTKSRFVSGLGFDIRGCDAARANDLDEINFVDGLVVLISSTGQQHFMYEIGIQDLSEITDWVLDNIDIN